MSVNKRGDGGSGISVTAIVTVAVIVAVGLLIFLLLPALKKAGDKGSTLGQGEANIATEVLNCNVACTQNDGPTYCKQSRDLVFADKGTGKGTCLDMRNGITVTSINDQKQKVTRTEKVAEVNDCSALCVPAA